MGNVSEPALRCMVQVIKDEFSSKYEKISLCRLHELMCDLCLSKGEEKGLIKLIDLANRTEIKYEKFSLCPLIDRDREQFIKSVLTLHFHLLLFLGFKVYVRIYYIVVFSGPIS